VRFWAWFAVTGHWVTAQASGSRPVQGRSPVALAQCTFTSRPSRAISAIIHLGCKNAQNPLEKSLTRSVVENNGSGFALFDSARIAGFSLRTRIDINPVNLTALHSACKLKKIKCDDWKTIIHKNRSFSLLMCIMKFISSAYIIIRIKPKH